MTADLSNYQSSETAWRYDSMKSRLFCRIRDTEKELHRLRAQLDELERKPPLYHLFNWSA